jgi:hypothetical protein
MMTCLGGGEYLCGSSLYAGCEMGCSARREAIFSKRTGDGFTDVSKAENFNAG